MNRVEDAWGKILKQIEIFAEEEKKRLEKKKRVQEARRKRERRDD